MVSNKLIKIHHPYLFWIHTLLGYKIILYNNICIDFTKLQMQYPLPVTTL